LIPTWLRRYDRAWLLADVIAGMTDWALMVPQAPAYAGIAAVPVQNGLYVMPLAVVGYLLLGSSRHLYVGPSATVATLSASTVARIAGASTGSAEYIALTVALTLMVGVIYIVGGLARMGFVARFFARPVLEGFIVGLGLYIAIGQLPKVVWASKSRRGTRSRCWRTPSPTSGAGNGPRSRSGSHPRPSRSPQPTPTRCAPPQPPPRSRR
jgi:MFS superfamily sulfate permease-like transporter